MPLVSQLSLAGEGVWCLLIQDENFKRLVDELGHAINDALSDSQRISEVVNAIRAAGYDLFLVLEVTIGFNKLKDAEPASESDSALSAGESPSGSALHLTHQDTQFLRALKITVDEEKR